ncbi:MAG: hypothetical protein CM15mP120_18160 [Pseudomonadota bacterium]|nr:MAG: hypothetical protein CM15mP120_18160 [Pseudomonadota bacterium]
MEDVVIVDAARSPVGRKNGSLVAPTHRCTGSGHDATVGPQ